MNNLELSSIQWLIQAGALGVCFGLIWLFGKWISVRKNGKWTNGPNNVLIDLVRKCTEALIENNKALSRAGEYQIELAKSLQKLADAVQQIEEIISRKLRKKRSVRREKSTD